MTYCENCTNVRKPARAAPPWKWLCSRHPRLDGYGWVTQGTWDDAPPFLACNQVNGGACPLFNQKPENWEDIILQAKQRNSNL